MRMKERLAAIKLMERAKTNPEYLAELGITADMRINDMPETKGSGKTQERGSLICARSYGDYSE